MLRSDEETLGGNRKGSDMGRENGRCRLSPKDEKLISLKA
jgi:hypothetical protein